MDGVNNIVVVARILNECKISTETMPTALIVISKN